MLCDSKNYTLKFEYENMGSDNILYINYYMGRLLKFCIAVLFRYAGVGIHGVKELLYLFHSRSTLVGLNKNKLPLSLGCVEGLPTL